MNWTNTRTSFYIFYTLFWLIFLYAGLIVADFLIPKITTISPEIQVIDDSYQKQSEKQKKELLKSHVKSINLAEIERHKEFIELIESKGVIGISSYPDRNLLYCNEGYGWQIYKSDSYGFRNFDDQYKSKVDVAIFGDSFIHGGCVPTEATISQVMNKYGNVMGFGLGGSDPIHYASMLKVMIPRVKPKQAGIAFYNNDFNDSDETSIFYKYIIKGDSHENYFDDNGNLSSNIDEYFRSVLQISEKKAANSPKRGRGQKLSFSDLIIKFQKYMLLNNIRAILYKYIPDFVPLSGLSQSSKIAIDELMHQCDINKCSPFITYLPNSNYWNPNYVSSYYMAQLKEYAKNHGVRFIDLTDIIDSENLSHFSPRGGHYSIKGYKNVGEYLSHKLFLTKKRKFDVDQNNL